MLRFRFAFACLVLAVCAALPTMAQSWAGGESLEVRVEDPKGRSVAEAEVVLAPAGAPAGIVFAPFLTDARGRAAVGGIAAGTWELEVRRPGYMTYAAEIVLGDGKPAILSAAHRNVPGATATLRVRLGRAPGAAAPRLVPGVPGAAEAPIAAPSAAPIAPIATLAPPVAPAAPPAVPEVPTHPVPQEAVPSIAQPAPAAVIAPPVPRAPAIDVKAVASPAEPPPSAGAKAAPVPSAPPLRAMVAARAVARSCFECRPGESARGLDAAIAAGGERCPGDLRARLAATPPGEWPALGAALPSGCALLVIELALGERYTGFRYEASAPAGRSDDCRPGQECGAGACRFVGDPLLRQAQGKTLVAAVFESDAERAASFVVYTRSAR